MRKFYPSLPSFSFRHLSKSIFTLIVAVLFYVAGNSQCPVNIDFEAGDFSGWECWVGSSSAGGLQNVITWNPNTPVNPAQYPTRFQMLNSVPGNGRDPYGNFPVNCPNGSGRSIKLGNNSGGAQAEGVSYTFTIPANTNKFSLIYNYAVVFQDPGHQPIEQPALQIEITNLTDNNSINCSSFSFVATGGLPGFFQSPNPGGTTPVWCKNWSANTINLDGYAGKTIRLFFKTNDCVFQAHFGYAYIDVNAECSSSFVGATFCPDDTLVNVKAPSGYQGYRWFNNDFTQILGTQQTLTLNPPPLAGDSIFVELTPYNGYGCLDTLNAKLWDTLTLVANAGIDKITCDNNPVQIGVPPIDGRIYKWSPGLGLSDSTIANPFASPSVTTKYTLTVTNAGGGCATIDEVNVAVDILSDSLEQIGPSSYCRGLGQSVTLKVLPHHIIQWYKDGVAIPGATQTTYTALQTGVYYAIVRSNSGCSRTTASKQIFIYDTPTAAFSINNLVQCFSGHEFKFANNSTIASGNMFYAWDLGDGNLATTRNVNHTYGKEGNYTVKLLVLADGGCADSTKFDVTVNPSPVSAFTVDAAGQCFKDHRFVFSAQGTVSSGILTYRWDFGDGNFDNSNNISHRYAQPGTYAVTLTARETVGGCTDDSIINVVAYPQPTAAFTPNASTLCFPGHKFIMGNNSFISTGAIQYIWSFGDGKSDTAANAVHSYAKAGKYTIKLLANAPGGCLDSAFYDVEVFPTPSADFTAQPVCENLDVPVINRTTNNTTSVVRYAWNFGNGYTTNTTTPVYRYPAGGIYPLSLTVSTDQCPVSFNTKTMYLPIDKQEQGIRYPDKNAAFNFPEQLNARPIGNKATWQPPVSLSNRFSYVPSFTGILPQLYTVELRTSTGCVTVDTQFVKTNKKIKIYVPTGFTPGNDLTNERLRPVLIGFTKVNYFRIFDRWGKMLFSMNSDLPGWDGRLNGAVVNMQTVVWMIEAVDVDGKVHREQGNTVVIR